MARKPQSVEVSRPGTLRERDPFDLLADLPARWRDLLGEAPGAWGPAVDISETDDEYVFTAELPGMSKDDVTVEVENGVLTIRGEKHSERKSEKNEKRRYVERRYGSFSRSFTLPSDAKDDAVKASYEGGVLTIEVGRSEDKKPRVISIK